MDMITLVVVGLTCAALSTLLVGGVGLGVFGDLCVGLVGAIGGGLIADARGWSPSVGPVPADVVVAALGAILLLALARTLRTVRIPARR